MITPDAITCYCPLDRRVTADDAYAYDLSGEAEVREGAMPITLRPLTSEEEDRVVLRAMRHADLPQPTDASYPMLLGRVTCLGACAVGSPSSASLPHHWREWIGAQVLRLTREVAPYLPMP